MTYFINPPLTNRIKQVIYGTILGGSSLVKSNKGKNCYLSMRDKFDKWIYFKADELSLIASPSPFTIEKTIRWHSICYPFLNEIRSQFYNGKQRKINLKLMDSLSDVAFFVWFCDCGRYENGHVILNTHIWGEEESNQIIKYFSLIGYKSNIIKERGKIRIKLNKESSEDFMALASPHFPEWFFYTNRT